MYFEFEEQHDNPIRAKWRYIMMGAVTILLLLALSVRSVIPSIEKDLTDRITTILINNDLNNIVISASGRDVRLGGLVTESDYKMILEVTENIRGIRKIEYDFDLIGRTLGRTPKKIDKASKTDGSS